MRKLVKLFCLSICLFAWTGPLFLFSAEDEAKTVTLAAAASLKNAFDKDLIPRFEKKHKIKVQASYDSSGKLQTQIENGLPADVFMSAALTQMNALVKSGFVKEADVRPLLQNKLVLIKRKGARTKVTAFENILNAASIAIGDPKSVPAGQYAQEAFTKIGNWSAVSTFKALSLGTNVTEVLNWVAQGSAEVGVVYATDAASQPDVEVIAVLKEGILEKPVIYPLAKLSGTQNNNQKNAELFVNFLSSAESLAIFKKHGFTDNR